MNRARNELSDLLTRLGISEQEAGSITQDIQRADELLAQQGQVQVPPALLKKVEASIRKRLTEKGAARSWVNWSKRLAPLAAAVIMAVLGLVVLQLGTKSDATKVTTGQYAQRIAELEQLEGEIRLWRLGLARDYYQGEKIDDMTLAEFVIVWDDINWGMDKLFGKELNNENYT